MGCISKSTAVDTRGLACDGQPFTPLHGSYDRGTHTKYRILLEQGKNKIQKDEKESPRTGIISCVCYAEIALLPAPNRQTCNHYIHHM